MLQLPELELVHSELHDTIRCAREWGGKEVNLLFFSNPDKSRTNVQMGTLPPPHCFISWGLSLQGGITIDREAHVELVIGEKVLRNTPISHFAEVEEYHCLADMWSSPDFDLCGKVPPEQTEEYLLGTRQVGDGILIPAMQWFGVRLKGRIALSDDPADIRCTLIGLLLKPVTD